MIASSFSFCFFDKYIVKISCDNVIRFEATWTLILFQNNDEALICRTCITVRTITLQLAWTPLEGLISCKWIKVSGIREDRISGLLPGATLSRSPCLASLHPTPPQLVTTWLCVVFLGNWTPPSAPQAPCPQWAEDYRSWLPKRLQMIELLLGPA